MFKIVTFEEALNLAGNKKHVLLGNGFSIGWNTEIFRYDALLDQADFSSLNGDVRKVFEILFTKDFEIVISALRNAASLTEIYSSDVKLSEKFAQDGNKLKQILASTIAKSHPDQPSQIKKEEYQNCRRFLKNFNNIYTLNYDLLLYWVLMHTEEGDEIKCDDGFRAAENESVDYVVWDNGSNHTQNLYYLHGALHLFDAGSELQKFTWTKTGIRLLDQIREALDANLFPLIVAEGESKEKLTKINHSGYLHRAKRSFSGISGSLFIHGHSLSDNDDHIIELIPCTKINNLFISFNSNPFSEANTKKLMKIQSIIDERQKIISKKNKKGAQKELNVYFYSADNAHVWR